MAVSINVYMNIQAVNNGVEFPKFSGLNFPTPL